MPQVRTDARPGTTFTGVECIWGGGGGQLRRWSCNISVFLDSCECVAFFRSCFPDVYLSNGMSVV